MFSTVCYVDATQPWSCGFLSRHFATLPVDRVILIERHMVCTWRKDFCHVAGNMASLYFGRWWAKKNIRISICDLDSRVAAQTWCHTAPGGNISVTAKCEQGFNDGGKNISTKNNPRVELERVRGSAVIWADSPSPPRWWNRRKKTPEKPAPAVAGRSWLFHSSQFAPPVRSRETMLFSEPRRGKVSRPPVPVRSRFTIFWLRIQCSADGHAPRGKDTGAKKSYTFVCILTRAVCLFQVVHMHRVIKQHRRFQILQITVMQHNKWVISANATFDGVMTTRCVVVSGWLKYPKLHLHHHDIVLSTSRINKINIHSGGNDDEYDNK